MSNDNKISKNLSIADRNLAVWRLAGPIILANISVPLLGAVDTAVIGHLEHAYLLGAVAIGAIIFQFIYWSFGFLRMGTTGLTAQALGASDLEETRAIFLRAILIGGFVGIALWLFQWPIIKISLLLFEASNHVEENAELYFFIRIWSTPAVLINYCLVGWFIGVRNTRATLILQIWMNGLNIILDLLFVIGFGWGVAGVASATVLAEVSTALGGLLLYRRHLRRMNPKIGSIIGIEKLFDRAKIKHMFSVNFDIFVRTFCLISAFAFFTAEAAKFGDVTLAANAILIQFQHFLSFGLDGFAHAAEALVGGAVGAKDRQTLRSVVRISSLWALLVAGFYVLTYALLGGMIINLLTDIEEVRRHAMEFLPWLIISPILSVWSFMLDGIFIGATHTREMRNGMLISLAVFIVIAFFLKSEYGNHGLWLSLMIFMVVRGVTLGMFYSKLERSITDR